MSLPVDYWDYLGWRDTLASPRHSARQRGYARARGEHVYTPQVVVNGAAPEPGSDRTAIEDAIARTRHGTTLSVPTQVEVAGDKLAIKVLAGPRDGGSGEVWLCALSKSVPVSIGRGENEGRTVAYHNVVRQWIRLGDWTGAPRTFTVPLTDIRASEVDAVAAIVQVGTVEDPRTMLGAGFASLH
jgi:hypothetical protein